jgi:pimeloyl-ACP methyl ester carboxylesterase
VARYKGRPGDYSPSLEANLRSKPEGGGLRSPGLLRARGIALSRRELTLMLHGFNNHEGEAADAYQGFRVAQYSHWNDLPTGSLDRQLGDTFWPGDADWGWFDLVDFFVYPKAVGNAKRSAEVLENLILQLPNLERVNFIAHSLGSRLVLETVSRLLRRGHPSVGRICLMAAAVPCEMVESGGRFGDDLRQMQALGVKIHILHSDKDPVLKFTFVPGQALSGAGEPSLRALGLNGPPAGMPGLRANVTESKIPGAGHGDYWGRNLSDASLKATGEAGAFFGFGGTRRVIGVRILE